MKKIIISIVLFFMFFTGLSLANWRDSLKDSLSILKEKTQKVGNRIKNNLSKVDLETIKTKFSHLKENIKNIDSQKLKELKNMSEEKLKTFFTKENLKGKFEDFKEKIESIDTQKLKDFKNMSEEKIKEFVKKENVKKILYKTKYLGYKIKETFKDDTEIIKNKSVELAKKLKPRIQNLQEDVKLKLSVLGQKLGLKNQTSLDKRISKFIERQKNKYGSDDEKFLAKLSKVPSKINNLLKNSKLSQDLKDVLYYISLKIDEAKHSRTMDILRRFTNDAISITKQEIETLKRIGNNILR